ncbi:MAG: heat-inducible transcriptional repressor HrcA [Polyangiaceae bacterium]
MTVIPPLSKRARSVLYAVVTEFIATAEPVGSRTLTRKYGFSLSAATIRNELADLEDTGYLAQPHTSAGRVPTEAAFRIFIDALMQVREVSESDAARIRDYFGELNADSDILRETGKLLSDLSGAPAVLVRVRAESRTLLTLRFIPTRPFELLSVIVFSDGTVENRFIRVEKSVSEHELERVHNMLGEVVKGRTLAAIREFFAADTSRADEIATLRQLGRSLVRAATDNATRGVEVVIQGQSRLLESPEFGNVERVRELLFALEDRERLLTLLDRTLGSTHVNVFLGEETEKMVGFPVSLVAAPYSEEDGGASGAVGVIGPTRMDYPFVVPLVGATASAMSAAMRRLRDPKRQSE